MKKRRYCFAGADIRTTSRFAMARISVSASSRPKATTRRTTAKTAAAARVPALWNGHRHLKIVLLTVLYGDRRLARAGRRHREAVERRAGDDGGDGRITAHGSQGWVRGFRRLQCLGLTDRRERKAGGHHAEDFSQIDADDFRDAGLPYVSIRPGRQHTGRAHDRRSGGYRRDEFCLL